MNTYKRSKVKKLLPAFVLIPSLYYSVSFTWGILAGYLLCKLFCHLFVHSGKIDSIFLDLGKWRVHLHHWIMGIAVLAVIWLIDLFYLPALFAGFIVGIIIQDIYDYNDWYKVFSRVEAKP